MGAGTVSGHGSGLSEEKSQHTLEFIFLISFLGLLLMAAVSGLLVAIGVMAPLFTLILICPPAGFLFMAAEENYRYKALGIALLVAAAVLAIIWLVTNTFVN